MVFTSIFVLELWRTGERPFIIIDRAIVFRDKRDYLAWRDCALGKVS